jgi:hypothetical protein
VEDNQSSLNSFSFVAKLKRKAALELQFAEEFVNHPDAETARLGEIALDADITQLESVLNARHTLTYSQKLERHALVEKIGFHGAAKANPRVIEVDGKVQRVGVISRLRLKASHEEILLEAKRIVDNLEPMNSVYNSYFDNMKADLQALTNVHRRQNNRRWNKIEPYEQHSQTADWLDDKTKDGVR